ncbi:hypothetical protein QBC46DRAFT_381908 [Diplogelasinospora grovesii]|uniref:2EXR domain-containing protein n=1 Tax=Diplogelasinospora grovesii TaxID=303347 RepID=A0AAN6NCK4_9PEZI|nr:hypothetical protein QBC46DRAFT_381908 [Diplogelasinospora grovesii]
MLQTFHQFGQLPWELREMIWTLVIRPARPGVHIFEMYSYRDGEVSKKYDVAPFVRNRPPDSQLTATMSGTNRNPSTYLIDGGLWTACRESRLVIERAFESRKWDAVRDWQIKRRHRPSFVWDELTTPARPTNYDIYEENMPATGYFTADNSTKRFFTVFPHRDLIYLQPHNAETIDWCQISWSIPFTDYGSRGARHIALDFDSLGSVRKNSTLFENFMEAAFDNQVLSDLFFIDSEYKITAAESKKADKGERDVFYASDRRFVEVWENEGPGETRCQRFVKELGEAIEEVNLWKYERDWVHPDFNFGILACEYL